MRFRFAWSVLPEGIVVERSSFEASLLIAFAITRSGFPAIHTVCTRELLREDTHTRMFRSFIVSAIAFTCPVPSATLLVTVAVPVVSRLIAVVDVPLAGSTRSAVDLNCRYASMSKYFSRIRDADARPHAARRAVSKQFRSGLNLCETGLRRTARQSPFA